MSRKKGCDGIGPVLEAIEQRLMLSGTLEQQAVELFSVSPALFVENQGQWADPSVRYVHSGSGASVAMTDEGVGGPGRFDPGAWPGRPCRCVLFSRGNMEMGLPGGRS